MAEAEVSPFTLQGEPAGFGTLPMGCLDHEGYTMSNANDFYHKFIVELVPNNANDATRYVSDLKPVRPIQPRIMTRLFNSASRWAINAPDRMQVMYSHHEYARGNVSYLEEVSVETDDYAFAEARAWAYEGQVRPRLIHFSLPANPENYLWIDLSWPIRNILLPISQVSYANEKPNCTYVQINFTRLYGQLPTDGWMEDGNQRSFRNWTGDAKRGLVWDSSAATMRVDLGLLYKLLTIPRHMRKDDFNVFVALQLHRWDVGVPYDFTLPMNSTSHLVNETGRRVANYPLTGGMKWRRSTKGVAYDTFLSDISGVQLQFPPPPQSALVNILNTVVSVGLGFIPVIGPLLAISSNLAFMVLQNPYSVEIRDLLTIEFGIELAGAIIESAIGYQSHIKKVGTTMDDAPPPGTMPQPLYFGESPDDYKLNPNIMELTEAEKESAQKYGPKKLDDDT